MSGEWGALSPGFELQAVCVLTRRGRTLLQDLSLQLSPGKLYAIVGPNGAGKSTLLAVLSGWQRCARGDCCLDGCPLPAWSADALARRRAVMLQDTSVAFDYTVYELVELGRYPYRTCPSPHERELIEFALQQADLTTLRDRLISSLSGGERARAHWARAWVQIGCPTFDPADTTVPGHWLLLDEPTAALDLAYQHRLLKLLQTTTESLGIGVVVVLHDLNLALRYAHHVLVMHAGRLVAAGTPADVLTCDLVQQVWGVWPQRIQTQHAGVQLII